MLKWAIIGVIGATIIGGSWFAWANLSESDVVRDSKPSEKKLREQKEGEITKEKLNRYKEQGKNPFGAKTSSGDLTDFHYNEYIHGMSHQKVKAKKKWGFYELNPTRVQWLLDGLEKVSIPNEGTYRRILLKWKQGDFTEIDEDHNAIWSLQGGTVGKATGLLTEEEEQAFIQSHQ